MEHDQANALVEEREELCLLGVGHLLADIVKHDDVVAEEVIAVEHGGLGRAMGRKSGLDLGVIFEDLKEWFLLEAMAAGDDEHLEFRRALGACGVVGAECNGAD